MLATLLAGATIGASYVPVNCRPLSLSEIGVHYFRTEGIATLNLSDPDRAEYGRGSRVHTTRCGSLIATMPDPDYPDRFIAQNPQLFIIKDRTKNYTFTRDGLAEWSSAGLRFPLNPKLSTRIPFSAADARFAFTSSLSRLAIVALRPDRKWSDVWTNSSGAWIKVSLEKEGLLFCPSSVAPDGTIAGSVYKTTDIELDQLAEGLPNGMEYQSRYPLRPATWQNGAWTFSKLPTTISRDHSFTTSLLMHWRGKNLAEVDEWNPKNRQQMFPRRFMVEQNGNYFDLSESIKSAFQEPLMLDFDVSTGRILFVESKPKTELDHRKYLIYQM